MSITSIPKLIWGKISDAVSKPARVDASTHTLQAIDYAHHEVHSGNSFVVSDVQNINNASMQWMITTPNSTTYAHALFSGACTGECQMVITEGADRTGTNALVEINHRRVGTPTVATTVVHRVVSGGSTDGAVTILSVRTGATGVGSKTVAAGGSRGVNEFILKPNTKYIVTITTYADIYVSFRVDWYEHEDKD